MVPIISTTSFHFEARRLWWAITIMATTRWESQWVVWQRIIVTKITTMTTWNSSLNALPRVLLAKCTINTQDICTIAHIKLSLKLSVNYRSVVRVNVVDNVSVSPGFLLTVNFLHADFRCSLWLENVDTKFESMAIFSSITLLIKLYAMNVSRLRVGFNGKHTRQKKEELCEARCGNLLWRSEEDGVKAQ